MKFLIQKAKPKDAQGIHEVILAAFEEFQYFYSPEGFTDTVMSEKAVAKRIENMTIHIVVDQNSGIIGTIGWKKLSEKEGHIRGMAVPPKMQGKESPAAELLRKVEEDARSQGCSFLTLDTTQVLQRAQNFYRKNGFRKTNKTSDFFGATVYEFAKKISTK